MDLGPLNYIQKFGLAAAVRQLVDLFPKGIIWNIPSTPDTLWGALLASFADERVRTEEDVTSLLIEAIPGLSTELLSDWERILGLPDETYPENPTIEQRRLLVHNKYVTKYVEMSISFYEQLALDFGAVVTIDDAAAGGEPFRVDQSRVDRTPALGIDGARLNSTHLTNTWIATISGTATNKDIIHKLFLKYKPAHTLLIWVET